MKGIALFATLMGVYNWLSQGTSLFDILVIVFATALVISIDSEKKEANIEEVNAGDNQTLKNLILKLWRLPLSSAALA
jgi:ABC-type enterobactin transport system permease subunit